LDLHAALAFLAGICLTIAGILLFFAFMGVSYYGVDLHMQMALALVIIAIAILIVWMLYKGVTANLAKVKTGKEALIGAQGIAVTDLKPKGEIRVLGEFWQATAKNAWIANGETVEVIGMDGMFLVVKPAKEKA
jgi:membrane-bound serine protease (ClpP class)